LELERPPGRLWPTRKVVGIYVGCAGCPFAVRRYRAGPDLLDPYGDRHRVAEESVAGGLARAKSLATRSTPPHGRASGPAQYRLVTIGHSFGGLIVYTALSQYFINSVGTRIWHRFPAPSLLGARWSTRIKTWEIAGYGDLVVVVNRR